MKRNFTRLALLGALVFGFMVPPSQTAAQVASNKKAARTTTKKRSKIYVFNSAISHPKGPKAKNKRKGKPSFASGSVSELALGENKRSATGPAHKNRRMKKKVHDARTNKYTPFQRYIKNGKKYSGEKD